MKSPKPGSNECPAEELKPKDSIGDSGLASLARIAAALERIADKQDYLASCADDSIDLLKELNQEFSSFSRHGFGM
ncbi:MAG: hypothetical protein EBZ78_13125 [Verrucomicrobia bacterium]|jgi:hypothetical protein|nr:hypothetical protein [Verrucomicrobiota bacterium]